MFEIGIALTINCLILNLYYRTDVVPKWLRNLVLGRLAKIVFVKLPAKVIEKIQIDKRENKTQERKRSSFIESKLGLTLKLHVLNNNHTIETGSIASTSAFLERNNSFNSNNSSMERCVEGQDEERLRHHQNHGESETDHSYNGNIELFEKDNDNSVQKHTFDTRKEIKEEWRLISRVIDRIMLFLAVFIGVLSALSIFFQAERFRTILFE